MCRIAYHKSTSRKTQEDKNFCVTSIYLGIALSSYFVASELESVIITLCIPDSISKMACQITFKFGMLM